MNLWMFILLLLTKGFRIEHSILFFIVSSLIFIFIFVEGFVSF